MTDLTSAFSAVSDNVPAGTYYTFLVAHTSDKVLEDYVSAIEKVTAKMENVSIAKLTSVKGGAASDLKKILQRTQENNTTEHVIVMGKDLKDFSFNGRNVIDGLSELLKTSDTATASYLTTDAVQSHISRYDENLCIAAESSRYADRFDWRYLKTEQPVDVTITKSLASLGLIKTDNNPKPGMK